ncbi:MAG TPA: hypothetical protein VGF81_10190 [Solirubrobacteraceae bacterium]
MGGAWAQSAAAQQPLAAPPHVIDGPSASIVRPAGIAMSIARDGTGGLVYLKQVAGVQHVFVSALTGGSFQTPVQVDPGLGASSQPVIAAGNGGVLLIAFVSGGELYVVDRPGASSGFVAPAGLAAGASNPAISITNFSKAYLAFAAGGAVRAAYYNLGVWSVAPTPFSISSADGAGTGSGRPAVAAAGDGVGIVAWGEAGHIFTRRIWGTSVSVATVQADAALPGCSELSAGEPAVGSEGNSSYADVAFHEVLGCGSPAQQRSRVLINRLVASQFLGVTAADGSAGSSGADDPGITMGEYGHGWITATGTTSNALIGTALGDDGQVWGTTQVNGAANLTAPDGDPVTAGLFSNLIAWQQSPGSSGQPEIRVRYAPGGSTLGPEIVASSPAQGPTDADNGLAGAGDVAGDSAVAWVQGAPGATEIVAAQLYQAPPPFGTTGPGRYVGLPEPQLSWAAPNELWGPVTYTVTLDGNPIGRTQATTFIVPTALPDGPHAWTVTAANPVGQTSQTGVVGVFVDTVAPTGQIALSGTRLIGHSLNTFFTYADPPPPGDPTTDASGISTAVVSWGDGNVSRLHTGWHRSFHTYKSPGTYTITGVVSDRAGNVGHATLVVRIAKPRPKPKPKPKPNKPGHGRRR